MPSPHTDTARSAALMPGEHCPAWCAACGDTATLTLGYDATLRPLEWSATVDDADGYTLAHYTAHNLRTMLKVIADEALTGFTPQASR